MEAFIETSIKYCPKCVIQRENGEKFCNLCGTQLAVKPNRCPCNGTLYYYDKFCSHCGRQVEKEVRKVLEDLDYYGRDGL